MYVRDSCDRAIAPLSLTQARSTAEERKRQRGGWRGSTGSGMTKKNGVCNNQYAKTKEQHFFLRPRARSGERCARWAVAPVAFNLWRRDASPCHTYWLLCG